MQPRCCSGAAMLASHVRWSFLQPQISIKHSPHQRAIYFATRYVDNRVLLLPEQLLSLPPFKQLTSASFYKPPVQLETEPANIFLGFAVDPSQRTVTHQSQLTTADITHPRSATTAQTLRSSFQARTRLINRVTHPHAATFSAIRAMRSTYRAAGYIGGLDQNKLRVCPVTLYHTCTLQVSLSQCHAAVTAAILGRASLR